MSAILRRFRMAVATLLALAIGSLPACGTMGGGGMHFVEPATAALARAAA